MGSNFLIAMEVKMKASSGVLGFLVVLFPLAVGEHPAEACGGFFSTTETQIVDMSDQRVLLVYSDAGTVDHFVQVVYNGKPSSFAWVYPFPGNPHIEEASEDIFSRLDSLTRPTFHITTSSEGGGCGCGSVGGDLSKAALPPSVTVWDTGQVGIFEYAVITAVTINDMLQWLADNGYRAPTEANSVLQHYVDRGWFFVAMKIAPDTEASVSKTSVLRFTYAYDSMTYPLYMTSISPAPKVGVLIYVIAPHRVQTTGTYVTRQIPRDKVIATSPDSTNYEQLFENFIRRVGGKTFIVEWVERGMHSILREFGVSTVGMGECVLTRLRSSLTPASLSDDVTFTFAPTDEEIFSVFYLDYPPHEEAGAWPLLPVILLLLGCVLARLVAPLKRRS